MDIYNFVSKFNNHPVLFIGTGISLRYLNNSYSWDGLLEKIAIDLCGNKEYYLDVKSKCEENNNYRYDKIASLIEERFNDEVKRDRNGRFKHINDLFYTKMEKGINASRFKIYITELLRELQFRPNKEEEITELKRVRKNIGSIITTNYDKLIECIFEFNPLVGNDILLSNPYGTLYKIHGCVDSPDKIIITEKDYEKFDKRYELIRAQLLSLFIHNPIIFLGYNIGDRNIKNILKTIFLYVSPDSEQAQKIKDNFLLVEFDEDSRNLEITDHDIDMPSIGTIRINKLKTDNYIEIYKAIAGLHLPISAMDIKKVQDIVCQIVSGGSGGKIRVSITEDIDSLKNEDKIIAIGSPKTITYNYSTQSEMLMNYFKIIDESNEQWLTLIDQYKIQKTQYFPIYAFSRINSNLENAEKLKAQENDKIKKIIDVEKISKYKVHTSIDDVINDENIPNSYKQDVVLWSILEDGISLEETEIYLRNYHDKRSTSYHKLLCVYDFKKYGDDEQQ